MAVELNFGAVVAESLAKYIFWELTDHAWLFFKTLSYSFGVYCVGKISLKSTAWILMKLLGRNHLWLTFGTNLIQDGGTIN